MILVVVEEPFASDLHQGVKRLSPSSSPPATTKWTATFITTSAISPTSSSVSSPGSRVAPANFEFQPITADTVQLFYFVMLCFIKCII